MSGTLEECVALYERYRTEIEESCGVNLSHVQMKDMREYTRDLMEYFREEIDLPPPPHHPLLKLISTGMLLVGSVACAYAGMRARWKYEMHYHPALKTIYVNKRKMPRDEGLRSILVAHETCHALQDEIISLEYLGDDLRLALVEGFANHLSLDRMDVGDYAEERRQLFLSARESDSPVDRLLGFGYHFFTETAKQGIDAVWILKNLPRSMEEIVSPEKYIERVTSLMCS